MDIVHLNQVLCAIDGNLWITKDFDELKTPLIITCPKMPCIMPLYCYPYQQPSSGEYDYPFLTFNILCAPQTPSLATPSKNSVVMPSKTSRKIMTHYFEDCL